MMTTNLTRKRYQFDLAALQRLAASNYVGLQPWLADLEARQSFVVKIGRQLCFTVTVLQQAPFTTDIRIAQQAFTKSLPGLRATQLEVRLYHDVRLAEVISCQGVAQLRARYDIPNPSMFQANEKQQVNQFLRDWIQLIRTHGLQEA